MIGTQDTFLRNPHAVTATVDDQLVALDVESGSCFGLNEVATVIWNMLEAPASVESLCAALLEIYDVDQVTCREEVAALIEDLLSCQLISRA